MLISECTTQIYSGALFRAPHSSPTNVWRIHVRRRWTASLRKECSVVTTFVLFLREGLEAALVIGMLLAALRQMGQTAQMRAVWTGAALAIFAALGGGIAVYATIHEYEDTTFAAVFEAITFLVAVVLLTSVTFWMQRHSRTLKSEITAKASAAGSGLALGL